jgi:glucose/arabinose dehydrogenase
VRRLVNLALFAVVAGIVVFGLVWLFRGQALRLAGVNFDTGAGQVGGASVPNGYAVAPFATGLAEPRFMAAAPDGTLFVAERGADRIVALPDRDGDGAADETIVVGSGYDRAHSLTFAADGTLLVAGNRTLFAIELADDLRERSRRPFLDLPPDGAHSTRTVAVLQDGRILVSVGSSCNVCWEDDPRRAAILVADADGSNAHVLMRGLRNAVGVTVDPVTGTAWATNNGRDLLGDDQPPETLYRVDDGADAGWPRCHAGTLVDPEFGTQPDPTTGQVGCDRAVAPAATFQAHMAPLGMAIWGDDAYIAFHGSWNRSTKVGYEVRRLRWSGDGPAGPDEPFLTGFLDDANGDSTGRPAGLIVGSDGALYVSDDKAGAIYRVTRTP